MSKDALIEKLKLIENRSKEIDEQLMSQEILSDPRTLAKLAKEQSQLQKVLSPYHTLLKVIDNKQQAFEMSQLEDEELSEMGQLEYDEMVEEEIKLRQQLEVLLIPKDANDDKDALVEIRGAAGGDEGNIFAGDLYRMYSKYAESQGFKIEVLDASESEAGGYTLISFAVKGGEDPYGHLKYESGAHRVQRVPKTETQGRVHTSTATVLVLPEIEEEDFHIDPADLDISTQRSSGAGGQHVNTTDSAVRIVHKPTGITVNMQDGRSQHDNRDRAMKVIRARVYEHHQEQKLKEEGDTRRSKIGTGDRAEKIRTYNYPQNRVSDHRINLTITQLDRIMEGKLGDVIDALIEADQKAKLESNEI